MENLETTTTMGNQINEFSNNLIEFKDEMVRNTINLNYNIPNQDLDNGPQWNRVWITAGPYTYHIEHFEGLEPEITRWLTLDNDNDNVKEEVAKFEVEEETIEFVMTDDQIKCFESLEFFYNESQIDYDAYKKGLLEIFPKQHIKEVNVLTGMYAGHTIKEIEILNVKNLTNK